MASATRPNVKRYGEVKKNARPDSAAKARKSLLNDLVDDAKRCLATKNEAEQKDFIHAVKKIANS